MTLVALMFVGGCAGSTSGSIKVVRHVLMGKSLRRELRQTVHPEEVRADPAQPPSCSTSERSARSTVFILLYVGIFVAGAGVIAVDTAIQGPELTADRRHRRRGDDARQRRPGLGIAGPVGSFERFSDVSTVTMTLLMWIGRLEVIPVLVLLTRRYWRV